MSGAATASGAGDASLFFLTCVTPPFKNKSVGFNFFLFPFQLEELRASECALRVRVKSLTNELALLRRGLDNLSVYYIFTFSLSYIRLHA